MSILLFICVTGVHIVVYRVLVACGVKTIKTVAIYGFGLIVLSWLLLTKHSPFPLTAITVYVLVSMLYIMLFTSPLFGQIGPSVKVFLLAKKYPGITKTEILKHFTDKELIDERVQLFISLGLLTKKNNVFTATARGQSIARIVALYRNIFHWRSGG